MDKVLKSTKVSIILSSFFSVLLGIVLLCYPQLTMTAICYTFGGILLLCALFHVFLCIKNKSKNILFSINLIIAVIAGAMGIWIMIKPSMVTNIVPVIFGVVLIFYFLIDGKQTFELKDKFYSSWWIILLLTFINVVFAVLLFVNPFKDQKTLIVAIGIGLIYNGIISLWILWKLFKVDKSIERSLNTINDAYTDEKL